MALSLAGSLKLNSIFPLSGFGNAPLARYAVIVFLTLIGLAAMGSAIACIHAARDAADIIYRRMGPYGLSRNPMSLGLIAVYGAIAVAADAPAALASLPVAFWLIEVFAVLPNERRLKGQMGLSFENYCRDVPRWI